MSNASATNAKKRAQLCAAVLDEASIASAASGAAVSDDASKQPRKARKFGEPAPAEDGSANGAAGAALPAPSPVRLRLPNSSVELEADFPRKLPNSKSEVLISSVHLEPNTTITPANSFTYVKSGRGRDPLLFLSPLAEVGAGNTSTGRAPLVQEVRRLLDVFGEEEANLNAEGDEQAEIVQLPTSLTLETEHGELELTCSRMLDVLHKVRESFVSEINKHPRNRATVVSGFGDDSAEPTVKEIHQYSARSILGDANKADAEEAGFYKAKIHRSLLRAFVLSEEHTSAPGLKTFDKDSGSLLMGLLRTALVGYDTAKAVIGQPHPFERFLKALDDKKTQYLLCAVNELTCFYANEPDAKTASQFPNLRSVAPSYRVSGFALIPLSLVQQRCKEIAMAAAEDRVVGEVDLNALVSVRCCGGAPNDRTQFVVRGWKAASSVLVATFSLWATYLTKQVTYRKRAVPE